MSPRRDRRSATGLGVLLAALVQTGCAGGAPAQTDDVAEVACRRAVAERLGVPGGADGRGVEVRRLVVSQSGGSWRVQGESAPADGRASTSFACFVQPDGSDGDVTVAEVVLR